MTDYLCNFDMFKHHPRDAYYCVAPSMQFYQQMVQDLNLSRHSDAKAVVRPVIQPDQLRGAIGGDIILDTEEHFNNAAMLPTMSGLTLRFQAIRECDQRGQEFKYRFETLDWLNDLDKLPGISTGFGFGREIDEKLWNEYTLTELRGMWACPTQLSEWLLTHRSQPIEALLRTMGIAPTGLERADILESRKNVRPNTGPAARRQSGIKDFRPRVITEP